jgi:hypothetical protein
VLTRFLTRFARTPVARGIARFLAPSCQRCITSSIVIGSSSRYAIPPTSLVAEMRIAMVAELMAETAGVRAD